MRPGIFHGKMQTTLYNAVCCGPGAAAKQSTIFHVTLLRLLSPQQLLPPEVAAVQAAVDAAATALVGQRFTPHHMLCAPTANTCASTAAAVLLPDLAYSCVHLPCRYVLERQYTTVEGDRLECAFAAPAAPSDREPPC
jgi:hypothetical protein